MAQHPALRPPRFETQFMMGQMFVLTGNGIEMSKQTWDARHNNPTTIEFLKYLQRNFTAPFTYDDVKEDFEQRYPEHRPPRPTSVALPEPSYVQKRFGDAQRDGFITYAPFLSPDLSGETGSFTGPTRGPFKHL